MVWGVGLGADCVTMGTDCPATVCLITDCVAVVADCMTGGPLGFCLKSTASRSSMALSTFFSSTGTENKVTIIKIIQIQPAGDCKKVSLCLCLGWRAS